MHACTAHGCFALLQRPALLSDLCSQMVSLPLLTLLARKGSSRMTTTMHSRHGAATPPDTQGPASSSSSSSSGSTAAAAQDEKQQCDAIAKMGELDASRKVCNQLAMISRNHPASMLLHCAVRFATTVANHNTLLPCQLGLQQQQQGAGAATHRMLWKAVEGASQCSCWPAWLMRASQTRPGEPGPAGTNQR